jgi:hypothetical protein
MEQTRSAAVKGGHGRAGHGAVVDWYLSSARLPPEQGLRDFKGSAVPGSTPMTLAILMAASASADTDAWAGLAFNHGDGCGSAAGITATPTIGAGHEIFHFGNARVFINVKDFGGNTEDDATGCANAQHNENSDGHENLLESIYTMPRKA